MGFFTGAFFSTVGLFLLQLMLIIGLPRVINYGLVHIGQPLVLSELITGIIYGPSLMGRVPNWTNWIFPASSLPLLNGLAQLGLVLFMFVVGISLDISQIRKNWARVTAAAVLGNITPFIAAVPLAFFLDDPKYTSTSLGVLILLLAVAFGVSALAFLARVLGERKLLGTELAVLTLCTTAVDTGVAWIEMAIVLAVGVTKGGDVLDSLAPVWVVILSFAQIVLVFLVGSFILRMIGRHVAKKGQLETLYFWMTIFLLFGVAWLTEEIGISGMLGAFEFGLCVPKNGSYNVGLKSKIEEIVVMLMIPVYFTVSGLKTDFAQMDTWDSWLIMLLLVVAATIVKMPGVMIPAKVFGLGWWDSLSFGVLMSCKGLVALVMYNLVLDAGLVTPRLFAMLVGYVLVTTFLVTPLMSGIAALKTWGVAKAARKKKAREKYIIFMLPRTPQMAPPIMTLAAHLNTNDFNTKNLPVEFRVARIVDPNDRYIGLMSRKTYKQDIIFAPATQRANFFKARLEYEYITSTDPQEDLVERINEADVRPDMFLMGNDLTHLGEDLVTHVLFYGKTMRTLIYTGHDFSNTLHTVMLAYRGISDADTLAVEVTKHLVEHQSVRKVLVLLLAGAPDAAEIDFLGAEANYFGEGVDVSVAERRDDDDILKAITEQMEEEVAKDADRDDGADAEAGKAKGGGGGNKVDFLVVARFDSGESESELKHILTKLSTEMCPSMYVSTKGSRLDPASESTPATTEGDATEMTDLTQGATDIEQGGDGGGGRSDSEYETDRDQEEEKEETSSASDSEEKKK